MALCARLAFNEAMNSTKSGNTLALRSQAVDETCVDGFDALRGGRVLGPIAQVELVRLVEGTTDEQTSVAHASVTLWRVPPVLVRHLATRMTAAPFSLIQ